MKIAQVKKLPVFDRLVYWIKERESIRLKRQLREPWPWTDDEILLKYRFCNVRRMDDKVSQWLLKNWYKPYKDHPNMLVAVVMARNFNLPSVLGMIGFPKEWEPEKIKDKVRCYKAGGNCVFNGAYMVRGMSKREKHYTPCKSDQVIDRMVQPLYASNIILNTSSMSKAVDQLLPYWGFSTFMAGQVVADLRWALSGSWEDAKQWAPVGPGSLRGMSWLLGSPANPKEFSTDLLGLIKRLSIRLPESISSRLEAIDYQSCCCEFDKYERTIQGEGKPKQLYRGPHATTN